MKVVHIAFSFGLANVGGAAIAASRLHLALKRLGIDSVYLCTYNFDKPRADVIEVPFRGTLRRSLFLWCTRILRALSRLLPPHEKVPLHILPSGVLSEIKRLNPDVVHVHRICPDAVSFAELSCLPCPVLVNLHDFWMISPIDPYPHETAVQKVRDRTMLARYLASCKRRFLRQDGVSLIAPSKWARDYGKAEGLSSSLSVVYLPYVQDPTFTYHPEMHEPHVKVRLLFGSYAGRAPSIKGYKYLRDALTEMSPDEQSLFELYVFGETGGVEHIGCVQIIFLGAVQSPDAMMKIYHRMDGFVFPSEQETQGQVKLEAMLCGTPVVAYERTACSEGIVPGKSGWVVNEGAGEKMKDVLLKAARVVMEKSIDRKLVSDVTLSQYGERMVVERYLAAYCKAKDQDR